MPKSKYLTFFLTLLTALAWLTSSYPAPVWAASLSVESEKVFGNKERDRGLMSREVSDGGCVVLAESESHYLHGAGKKDALLWKLDDNNYLKWQKTYGGGNEDVCYSLQQTRDKGFILTGYSKSKDWRNNQDLYLVKIDEQGQRQWQMMIGDNAEESGKWVEETAEGGFIVAGETITATGDTDIYLVKTNANGRVEWQKTFGGKDIDTSSSVLPTPDGGYLVAGQTASLGAGNLDIYLLKVDAKGNKEWEKTFGGTGRDVVNSLSQTKAGDFLLAGETTSYNETSSDAYLMKISSTGHQLWEQTYAPNGWAIGKSVSETVEGNILLAGWTNAKNGSGYDFFLVETDVNGQKVQEKTLSNAKFVDERFHIQRVTSGFLISGWWIDFMKWTKAYNDEAEIYLMKLKLE